MKKSYCLFLVTIMIMGTLNAQSTFYEGAFSNCDSVSINNSKSIIDLTGLNIKKIELVAFDYTFLKYKKKTYLPHSDSQIIWKKRGKRSRYKYKKIKDFKIENLSVNYNYLKEHSIVNDANEISLILKSIKNSYKPDKWKKNGSALCYEPRNAIVFKSKNDKIEFIIELCFQCNNHIIVSQGNKSFGICSQTIDYIFNLFKSKGIKHGIERHLK